MVVALSKKIHQHPPWRRRMHFQKLTIQQDDDPKGRAFSVHLVAWLAAPEVVPPPNGSTVRPLLLACSKAAHPAARRQAAEGADFDARVTRQGNGRPHRIGQTEAVRILYPHYADTLQATALDLVARKITASLQVDGLSLAGALEAAGALSDEDRLHADAALTFGEALYRAAVSHR